MPGDRVYQGMTIAFDFSIEEIWVPLMAGATLVPARPGLSLIGDELADFLRERRVTCHGLLPDACWRRSSRTCRSCASCWSAAKPARRISSRAGTARAARILNSYGPTEATVTATLTELKPDKPVTIGVPLPTYSIVILDPAEDKTVAPGELGEIGIAGVGLALGYMNRDELTMKKFIRDFLNIQNNPSGPHLSHRRPRPHRRRTARSNIAAASTRQVKIRGYRIELNEIEAVLLDLPQIAQAAVTTFEPEPGVVELVAYYAFKQGADLPRDEISQALRGKLPPYMVPSYLEELPVIPMTLSNKADHKKLPKPQVPRFSAGTSYVPPKTENERILAAALASVLRVERVSTEHHFFDDLGANSLLMARFCAAIRKNPGMSNVSMRDIYTNPTIARARRSSRFIDRRLCRDAAPNRSTFPRTCPTTPAARCSLRSTRPTRCSAFGCSTPAINGRPRRTARSRSTRAASCSPRDRSSR